MPLQAQSESDRYVVQSAPASGNRHRSSNCARPGAMGAPVRLPGPQELDGILCHGDTRGGSLKRAIGTSGKESGICGLAHHAGVVALVIEGQADRCLRAFYETWKITPSDPPNWLSRRPIDNLDVVHNRSSSTMFDTGSREHRPRAPFAAP